ncbi:tRNA (uridine(54)-C5)-methyltransferase TrmA [Motiliproteus sediminis]|uniref:tRNA (uridine(54)-C5)-methyltransferase TrmA n=1 Tax=Motiliproteus sediminis TaxID=1468178 RepID=UPI001AEFF55A|nr:tRNA (uridine(54)-C5)-methyltransferase TrmA [Motiliproteus sediminis]
MSLGQVFPEQYQQQLDAKAAELRTLMAPFNAPEPEVFASPAEHYRMRAEFRIWHEGDDLFYAMFEPGDKRAPVRIDQCRMVSSTIEDCMFPLLDAIRADELLRRRLFQIDFLSTTTGELLVTLIYHRPLDAAWEQAARDLQRSLGLEIIGRSRKSKIVLARDWVEERLPIAGRELRYQQVENSFTQPNASISMAMLSWARAAVAGVGRDLLELYCGNGNFTVALSDLFDRVLATEISKSSVNSALFNLELNQVTNVAIARLSSEEFTQAMNREREFRRLRHIDLDDYDFGTVLVDPPRAGLDPGTEALVQRFERILYISCNPETLAGNLGTLCQTHRVERLALFDQFPYTAHKECGVWLVRK